MPRPELSRGSQGHSGFHPLVREWFDSRFEVPTAVQEGVWFALAKGENVLAEAPTGNGKTLAAFLHALSSLVSGELPSDRLSVLYISPLKALNEDIRRNLEEPIRGIKQLALSHNLSVPDLSVETRSGDTTEVARRRFLRRPPAILCTTPESFAILLNSPRARPILANIRLLVVDEIHALAGNKRGALLSACIGRLVFLAGEFQRVALSATIRPALEIAEWFAGSRLEGRAGRDALYVQRPITLVAPPLKKNLQFRVEWPEMQQPRPDSRSQGEPSETSRYFALVPAFIERALINRTSLIFCDARRRAERIAFLMNQANATGETLAWAHHGSLSREIREVIENRLKAGELRCVVATSSLELGIDIGSIDEVILAGAPPSIASAIQRAGRSGHGVGLTSKVILFPFHGLELLTAGAIVREAGRGTIEAITPARNPLDILVQVLLSLIAEEERDIETLYDIVRSLSPFRSLTRRLFDSSLELLAGRWSASRLRELEPRVHIDRASGRVSAAKGALRLLHLSGGTIPDRGLFSLRLEGDDKRIGELDEEFVWERKVGDSFTMGSQAWRIVDIGPEAVRVRPLDRAADFLPFWKGGPNYSSPELASGLLDLLDKLVKSRPGDIRDILLSECGFTVNAAVEAERFIGAQRSAQGRIPLPGRASIVLELVEGGRRQGANLLIMHTIRGGKINEALGLVIAAAFEEAGRTVPQIMADDEGLALLLPDEPRPWVEELATLLIGLGSRSRVEKLLHARLEHSGIFASTFRENSGRALLLPKGFPGKRVPLWMTRLRASKLFEAVKSESDFPLTLETWRSVLVEAFNVEGLYEFLEDLNARRVSIGSFRSSQPSPFASGARWAETNEYMYRGDDLGGGQSKLSTDAIAEALGSAGRRPRISADLAEDFARRKKRLIAGWAPEDPRELAEWIKERVAIESSELDEVVRLGNFVESWNLDPTVGGRLVEIRMRDASEGLIVHAEREDALLNDPGAALAEWLRFEGVVSRDRVSALFGIGEGDLEIIPDLVAEGLILDDVLLDSSDESYLMDRENCEALLRIGRAAARPRVEAKPPENIFKLIALFQGLGAGSSEEGREAAAIMESLAGFPAPVAIWETAILPARFGTAAIGVMERLVAEEGWLWFGTGRESIAFANAWNYELFAPPRLKSSSLVSSDDSARDFWAIQEGSGMDSKACALAIWAEAWEGRITSDSYLSLTKGRGNTFGKDIDDVAEATEALGSPVRLRRIPRALRQRWRRGAPVHGLWSSLDLGSEEGDPLDEEELDRERIRVLLRRYGIILRPLLDRELGGLAWKKLFPCLRRMELAGEIVFGHFFEGIPGPQFISHEALARFLRLEEIHQPASWISALDPASPAGFPFDNKVSMVPSRRATTWLCLKEGLVVAQALRLGRSLHFAPDLSADTKREILLAFVTCFQKIIIDTIDGRDAASTPEADFLLANGFERDRGRLRRW